MLVLHSLESRFFYKLGSNLVYHSYNFPNSHQKSFSTFSQYHVFVTATSPFLSRLFWIDPFFLPYVLMKFLTFCNFLVQSSHYTLRTIVCRAYVCYCADLEKINKERAFLSYCVDFEQIQNECSKLYWNTGKC